MANKGQSEPLLPGPSGSAGPSRLPAGPSFRPVAERFPIYNGTSDRARTADVDCPDPFDPQSLRAADARARKRLFQAIVAGLGLWLLLGLALGAGSIAQWGEPGWHRGRFRPHPEWPGGRPAPPAGEGKVISCGGFAASAMRRNDDDESSSGRQSAVFHLNLDPTGGLFVSARGTLSVGQVDLVVAAAEHETDERAGRGEYTVEAEVEARYDNASLLEYLNVCTLERGAGEVGLGFYSPSSDYGSVGSHLTLRVVVRIPPALAHLSSLRINAPQLSVVGSLPSPLIRLADFKLVDAGVDVDELHAKSLRVETVDGPISFKHLNTSRSLGLSTVNGRISAKSVTLFRPSADDGDDRLPLPPVDDDDSYGADLSGNVMAATQNGPIDLRFVGQPADHVVHLLVHTTTGRATVDMDPAYEGDVEVETTFGSAILARGPDFNSTTDPSGHHREHRLEIRSADHGIGFNRLVGTSWWSAAGRDDDRRSRGDAKVRTTLGPATLRLL